MIVPASECVFYFKWNRLKLWTDTKKEAMEIKMEMHWKQSDKKLFKKKANPASGRIVRL